MGRLAFEAMLCIVLVDELYYQMYYLVVKVKYFLAIEFYNFFVVGGRYTEQDYYYGLQ